MQKQFRKDMSVAISGLPKTSSLFIHSFNNEYID